MPLTKWWNLTAVLSTTYTSFKASKNSFSAGRFADFTNNIFSGSFYASTTLQSPYNASLRLANWMRVDDYFKIR